ncbi:MAG: hypothetical protein IJ560_03965 [Alphaproteobacteria bacterium]|nr:hypothetical protein [Alphaproteobacteria bacterium]
MRRISRDLLFLGGGIGVGLLIGIVATRGFRSTTEQDVKPATPDMGRVNVVHAKLVDVTNQINMYCATTECDSNTMDSLRKFTERVDNLDVAIERLSIDYDSVSSVCDSIRVLRSENMQNRNVLNSAASNLYRMENDKLRIELADARDSVKMYRRRITTRSR